MDFEALATYPVTLTPALKAECKRLVGDEPAKMVVLQELIEELLWDAPFDHEEEVLLEGLKKQDQLPEEFEIDTKWHQSEYTPAMEMVQVSYNLRGADATLRLGPGPGFTKAQQDMTRRKAARAWAVEHGHKRVCLKKPYEELSEEEREAEDLNLPF